MVYDEYIYVMKLGHSFSVPFRNKQMAVPLKFYINIYDN